VTFFVIYGTVFLSLFNYLDGELTTGLVDHHYYYYARFYELWLTCDSRVIPGVENVAKTQKKLTQD